MKLCNLNSYEFSNSAERDCLPRLLTVYEDIGQAESRRINKLCSYLDSDYFGECTLVVYTDILLVTVCGTLKLDTIDLTFHNYSSNCLFRWE